MKYGRIRRGPMAADVFGEHFTQIFNAAARDKRISRRARGFLLEISTHRDGYGISVSSLVDGGPEGRDAVTAGLKELEQYGYLKRWRDRDEAGRLGESVFEITDMPDGLVFSIADPWQTRNETRRSEPEPENPPQATSNENRRSAPVTENPAQAKPARANPLPKKNNYKNTRLEEDQDVAPSARSAGDGRRPSTGSSARAKSSGKAATSGARAPQTSNAGGKNTERKRLTRDQAAAIRAIEAAYPPQLAELLPKYRPTVVRDAALDALDSRTPAQIAARMTRRWTALGYADALLSAEGAGLRKPVGVAVTLIQPSPFCPEPMCEDGTVLDTGTQCRTCEGRHEERRRTGAVPKIPAPTRSRVPECTDCSRPFMKVAPPQDGVCDDCRAGAEEAFAQLAATLHHT